MIKFFRTFRKRLLPENKVSKYLLYAIGEIILVVIGILIALQVNEWNKERTRKIAEQDIIEQLIADLSKSQYELEEIARSNLRQARQYAQVSQAFWKAELPEDIEDYILRFRSAVYSPVQGTARSLINSGRLDILSSKALKNDLVVYVEAIDYTLKDINRYEESYFRSGVDLIFQTIPNTFESKEMINKRGIEGKRPRGYNYNTNRQPGYVDKVPFQTDLNQLFEDENFFRAITKLHLYHSNIFNKYNQLLKVTNELLVKLYKGSDKYQKSGEQLSNSEHYLIFEAVDLAILKRTDELLSDSSKWHKEEDGNCEGDIHSEVYSLTCALKEAFTAVAGEWDEDHLRPAVRLILFNIGKNENRRVIRNPVRDWNNHPDTTFEEVKQLLKKCIKVVEKQLE